MGIVVAVAVGWAAVAHVDSVTRAEARVVPDGREQLVASLEGGLLSELYVSEGSRVEAEQPLARLDPTRFETQHDEGQVKEFALRGTIARLEAEASGQPLSFPPELAKQTALQRDERAAYEARRRALDEALAAQRRSAELVQRELHLAERMSSQGLMSEVEVMRLQRQYNDQQMQIQERVNRFRQDARTELLRVRTDLAQLDKQQDNRADVLRRTVLTSPVRGLVKHIRVNTLGGVVAPGAPVMEIVPISDRLLVEARVKPADIGFLHPGQTAEMRLTAYDHTLYGLLHGQIEHISPDVLGDPDRPGGADPTYYRVMIRTKESVLRRGEQALPVIPGMTGTVDIRTGERTVLSFLMRPLLRTHEAFRER
jgi:adhesin transport system membrane fusion protein